MDKRLYLENLTKNEQTELFNIWHGSKGLSYKRYDRLIYTVKWFIDKFEHFENNKMSIYKIIDENVL